MAVASANVSAGLKVASTVCHEVMVTGPQVIVVRGIKAPVIGLRFIPVEELMASPGNDCPYPTVKSCEGFTVKLDDKPFSCGKLFLMLGACRLIVVLLPLE